MKKELSKKKLFGTIITLLLFLYYIVTWWFIYYALGPNKAAGKRKTVGKDNKDDSDDEPKVEDIQVENWLLNTKKKEVNLFSKDNFKLYGRKFIHKNSHKWVIAVHGYRSNGESMKEYAFQYYRNGYNVILPDLRSHGKSGGKYIGMGWLDKNDVKLWIKHIINIDREAEIILHGVSMGASCVMMLSGDELPDNVKVIIEDCGYTSVYDIFKAECKARFRIVHYPSLFLGDLLCKLHIGYGWREASAKEALKNNFDIPMLFIHGDNDKFVPFRMLDELYDTAVCDKEKYIVKGAGHAKSKDVAKEEYWSKVFTFIEEYIGR